jgi:beta-galactosidase
VNARNVVEGVWEVTSSEGEIAASGKLPELDLEPRQEKEFALALPATLPRTDSRRTTEYWLNVRFLTRAETMWAPRGHEVGWEQWPLPYKSPRIHVIDHEADPLSVRSTGQLIRITGRNFALIFDRVQGTLASYSYKGVKLLDRGPLPDFWRAMTDNDVGAWKSTVNNARKDPGSDVTVWRQAGPSWSVKDIQMREINPYATEIVVSGDLPVGEMKYAMKYTVDGTGGVLVEGTYTPGTNRVAMMPRAGMQLVVSPGLETITWLGRGPAETYVDRAFERIGIYSSTVRDQFVDYSRPQENGNKTDVRWVALTNKEGIGLLAHGMPLLSIGASHYTKRDLEQAQYSFQLPHRPEIYLNLDLKQMGVGGINSWNANAWPMEPYRIRGTEPHQYRFRVIPVSGKLLPQTR